MNTNSQTAVVKHEHDDEADNNDCHEHHNVLTTEATIVNTISGNKNFGKDCSDNEISSKTAKTTTARTPITTSVKVLTIPIRLVREGLIEKEAAQENEPETRVSTKTEISDASDDFIIQELEEEKQGVEKISPPLSSDHQRLVTHSCETTNIPATITQIFPTSPTTNALEPTAVQPPRPLSPRQKTQSSLRMVRRTPKPTTTTAKIMPQLAPYTLKKAIKSNTCQRLETQNNRSALTKIRILEGPSLPSLNPSSSAPTLPPLTKIRILEGPSLPPLNASSSAATLPPLSSILPLQAPLSHLNQTALAADKAATATATLATTTTDGLRVKCPCQLGSSSANSTAVDKADLEKLKIFFEQMFEETRRLSHQNQREVKMILLEAVSEAERNFEAGRNCKKCCG